MLPIKNKMLQLAEQLNQQLAPKLPPGSVKGVLRAALGIGGAPAGPGPALSCFAPAGLVPDLKALLAGRGLKRGPVSPPSQPDVGTFTARAIATPGGPYTYKLFVPESQTPPTALIVMLHGCTQDPDDFAAGTAMNAVAQRHNVLVAYPEQARSANMSRCWNWFLTQHQHRDKGEAGAIAAITREVMAAHKIAPGRVFVAGLSAGGAMAAIMAETYPDVFGGVGIHSGLAYGAAHDVASAFAAMRQGGKGGDAAGALAHGVPTIVFHGDADTTVDPSNADAILARLNARESGLQVTTEQGTAPTGRAYVKTIGRDADDRVRFENWTIKGASHAWAGGSASGTYTDPSGPDASAAMMRFFLAQIDADAASAKRAAA